MIYFDWYFSNGSNHQLVIIYQIMMSVSLSYEVHTWIPNLFGVLSALAKQNWRQVVGGNFFCADIMARRCVEVRFLGFRVTHLHLWGVHSSTQTIDVWYISLHLS